MSGDDLPAWVHYAQALVVPVLTVAGIAIAWGQFSLARMRIKLDLYDRRYKLFDSARRLIAEIVREGRSRNQDVLLFLRETGDAVFLLDRNVVNYFEELKNKSFRLTFLTTIMANNQHPQRDAAIDEETELLRWFSEQFDVLVEKFKAIVAVEVPVVLAGRAITSKPPRRCRRHEMPDRWARV